MPVSGRLCHSLRFVMNYDVIDAGGAEGEAVVWMEGDLSLIHISEPTRQAEISYAVFCLKKKTMLSLIHISEPTRQAEISYAVFCLKKKTNRP